MLSRHQWGYDPPPRGRPAGESESSWRDQSSGGIGRGEEGPEQTGLRPGCSIYIMTDLENTVSSDQQSEELAPVVEAPRREKPDWWGDLFVFLAGVAVGYCLAEVCFAWQEGRLLKGERRPQQQQVGGAGGTT